MNDSPTLQDLPTVHEAVVELVAQMLDAHITMSELNTLAIETFSLASCSPDESAWAAARESFIRQSKHLDERIVESHTRLTRLAERMIRPDD